MLIYILCCLQLRNQRGIQFFETSMNEDDTKIWIILKKKYKHLIIGLNAFESVYVLFMIHMIKKFK